MGKQKYNIEFVKSYLLENDKNEECTLLSSEYVNTKQKLLFKCNLCDKQFERNFESVKSVKRHCCSECSKKINGGARKKSTIQDVINFLQANDINNECELLSTEYVNSQTPLTLKCNLCGTTFQRNFTHIKRGRFSCEKCGELAGGKALSYSQEEVTELIKKDGYTALEEFKGSHKPLKVRCEEGHEFDLYFSEWLYNGRGCPQCAILKNSGDQHWNWNGGGHQETLEALRHVIIPWKKASLKNSDYKCDISGLHTDDLVVHHATKNFRALVDDACANTNIPLLNKVADYSFEDRQTLEKELLRLNEECKGIVMRRVYHDEFHSIYGKTNNTLEQYLEFKEMKQEGK